MESAQKIEKVDDWVKMMYSTLTANTISAKYKILTHPFETLNI